MISPVWQMLRTFDVGIKLNPGTVVLPERYGSPKTTTVEKNGNFWSTTRHIEMDNFLPALILAETAAVSLSAALWTTNSCVVSRCGPLDVQEAMSPCAPWLSNIRQWSRKQMRLVFVPVTTENNLGGRARGDQRVDLSYERSRSRWVATHKVSLYGKGRYEADVWKVQRVILRTATFAA